MSRKYVSGREVRVILKDEQMRAVRRRKKGGRVKKDDGWLKWRCVDRYLKGRQG